METKLEIKKEYRDRKLIYLSVDGKYQDKIEVLGDFSTINGYSHAFTIYQSYLGSNISLEKNTLKINLNDNELRVWIRLLTEINSFYETEIKEGLVNETTK